MDKVSDESNILEMDCDLDMENFISKNLHDFDICDTEMFDKNGETNQKICVGRKRRHPTNENSYAAFAPLVSFLKKFPRLTSHTEVTGYWYHFEVRGDKSRELLSLLQRLENMIKHNYFYHHFIEKYMQVYICFDCKIEFPVDLCFNRIIESEAENRHIQDKFISLFIAANKRRRYNK
ncbi:MAG: hypothetical protein ACRYGG_09010 [Janthinobacterium lividum]